ncbi:hypothetical protein TVAG_278990 [Trichomonas vaginalis G3]|uniref:Uncharacterized protein n=1 Tax=Trichomonas vaginalis (strain ATCC PRA-98 / G3) TaxID=412133 RepID=A2G7L2_TRIV3|nr:hypothetical protein TVAGG3_0097860 [Trichomonas vaginalis G3]EAX86858.1 hypothetical protein TVAG_278990 [Trichomonas vaginalis G3]KAI5544228.1 hypothetical protein TVAGG3_0097860 [Trichomonas vaginalis G3]|eukprot:XP_001299788.1 hypothetical protein [Trichomonas vaginalis G3]
MVTIVKTRTNPKTGKKEKYEVEVPIDSQEAIDAGVGKKLKKGRKLRRGKKGSTEAAATTTKKHIIRKGGRLVRRTIKIIRRKVNPKTKKEELVEEPKVIRVRLRKSDPPSVQQSLIEAAGIRACERSQLLVEKKKGRRGKKKGKKIVRKFVTIVRRVVNPDTGKEEVVEEKKLVECEVLPEASADIENQLVDKMTVEATEKNMNEEEKNRQKKDKKRGKRRIIHKIIEVIKKRTNPETNEEEVKEEKQIIAVSVPEENPPNLDNEIIQDIAKESAIKSQIEENNATGYSSKDVASEFITNSIKQINPETGKEEIIEELKLVSVNVNKGSSPEERSKAITDIANEAMQKEDLSTVVKKKKGKRIVRKIIKIVKKKVNPKTGKEEICEENKVVGVEVDDKSPPEVVENQIEKALLDIQNKENEENQEILAQFDAKNEGIDIQTTRARRKKKVIVQKFVKVIRKVVNPKTGKEEVVQEKKLINVEVPNDIPPSAQNQELQKVAKDLVSTMSSDSNNEIFPNFVTVVKKSRDPVTGKDIFVEDLQLIAAEVPKNSSPDAKEKAVETLAQESMKNEIDISQIPNAKIASQFVTVVQKEVNPETGLEEVFENKQLVSLVIPQNTPPEIEQQVIDNVSSEVIKQKSDEISKSDIDSNGDKTVVEVDQQTGEIRKVKRKAKPRRVVHKIIKTVKKVTNPITGKEELKEEKQLVAVQVPIDASPSEESQQLEEVAAEMIEKKQEEKELHEAKQTGEEIVSDVDRKTGRKILRKKNPKKRIVHKFITVVKKKVNPMTGKEELFEEKQLVAADVPIDVPQEVANAQVEKLAEEAIDEENKRKEYLEDKHAMQNGETDEQRMARKRRRKRVVHKYVTVVKKRVNPVTEKEELIEEKQLVSAEVPRETPPEAADAVIELMAAAQVQKSSAEEEKRFPRKKGRRVVHKFMTVVKKKVNPSTGKEEVVEEKQLVAAEVPQESNPSNDEAAIEAVVSEQVSKEQQKNEEANEKISSLTGKKPAKKRIVQKVIVVPRKKFNPQTGKEDIVNEKQLVAVEVPVQSSDNESKHVLDEIENLQKSGKRPIRKMIPVERYTVDSDTGLDKKYIDTVEIEFSEDDPDGERKATEAVYQHIRDDYLQKRQIYNQNKQAENDKVRAQMLSMQKAALEEKKRLEEEQQRIKLLESQKSNDESQFEEEEEEEIIDEEEEIIIEYSESESAPKEPKKPKVIIEYYEEDEEEEVEVHNITVEVDENGNVLNANDKVDGKSQSPMSMYKAGTNINDIIKQMGDNVIQKEVTIDENGNPIQ